MSIIQDALNRKEGGASPATVGGARPPYPPSGAPGGRASGQRNKLILVVLIVVLCGVLAWVAGSRFLFGGGSRTPAPVARAPAAPAPTRPAPVATNAAQTATAGDLISSASGVVARTVAAVSAVTTNLEQRIAAEMSATNPPPSAPVAMAESGSVAAAAMAGQGTGSNETSVAAGHPPRWPSFVVKGVIVVAGQPGLAMIDDQALDQGRTTRTGIRIVEVQKERVVLEFEGEQRTYGIGSGEP